MTAPLDEKGHDASTQALLNAFPMADKIAAMYAEVAIRAYLSAVALPDELEVVAWRHTLHMDGGETSVRLARAEVDRPWGKPGIDFDNTFIVTIEPLVRADQAQSALAAMRVERDEAWESREWHRVSLEAQTENLRTAEAQVQRMALRLNTSETTNGLLDGIIKRLTEALRFYADPATYRANGHPQIDADLKPIIYDAGSRARAAIEGMKK